MHTPRMYSEGNIIRGRYRLEARIGEGGMATVWRASHVALHRPVALKLVRTSDENREETVSRFLQEARVAASVRHRHVVDILDFGIAEDGSPFIAMELLEGESLSDRLARERVLELSDVAVLFDQILSGIAAVHDASIVHRDLKPENVFLVRDEDGFYVKLLDFGISRGALDPDLDEALDDEYASVVGTPHYMAPEQARGEVAVDHRADLYACGVMLYEALSGVPPYDAENVSDLLVAITSVPADPLITHRPDLPVVSGFVARAMARDPRRRFQTAREMRIALRDVLGPEMLARTAAYPAMVALGTVSGTALPMPLSSTDAPTLVEPGCALALRSPTQRHDRPTDRMTSEERTEARGRLFAFVGGLTLVFALASTSVSLTTESSTDEADAPDPRFFPPPAIPETRSIPAETLRMAAPEPLRERVVEGVEARTNEGIDGGIPGEDVERMEREARLARALERRKARHARREAEQRVPAEQSAPATEPIAPMVEREAGPPRSTGENVTAPVEEAAVPDEGTEDAPHAPSIDAQTDAELSASPTVETSKPYRAPIRRPTESRSEARTPAPAPTVITDPGF